MPEKPEQFRTIPDFPRYACSDRGRVRNVVRGNILRGSVGRKTGLREVFLRDADGRGYSVHVHVLVAKLFLGPHPAGHVIVHKSLDKLDNSVLNLEAVTRAELNRRTRARHPDLAAFVRGERHSGAKLSNTKVLLMRDWRARGLTFREIAWLFGVSSTTAYRALRGASWKHVV